MRGAEGACPLRSESGQLAMYKIAYDLSLLGMDGPAHITSRKE